MAMLGHFCLYFPFSRSRELPGSALNLPCSKNCLPGVRETICQHQSAVREAAERDIHLFSAMRIGCRMRVHGVKDELTGYAICTISHGPNALSKNNVPYDYSINSNWLQMRL